MPLLVNRPHFARPPCPKTSLMMMMRFALGFIGPVACQDLRRDDTKRGSRLQGGTWININNKIAQAPPPPPPSPPRTSPHCHHQSSITELVRIILSIRDPLTSSRFGSLTVPMYRPYPDLVYGADEGCPCRGYPGPSRLGLPPTVAGRGVHRGMKLPG